MSYFITIVDFTIVNVALPAIGRELRFPESDLQWVVTAYGLTFAGFVLLGGRAADLLGRRRVLMAGLAVFTAASLAGGLATSDIFLIMMRGIQGLGAALVLPAALSTVMNLYAEGAERNKALGIWGGVGALGGTVGLLAGGILTTYAGWQYIFFFNVPIGATALALVPKMVPESRAHNGPRRYDTGGAVSITAALLMLVYAISQAPEVGWAATQTVALLAAGAALLALFLVVETRAEAPLLPLSLLRLGGVAGSNAVGFLLGASFYHLRVPWHALHAAGTRFLCPRNGPGLDDGVGDLIHAGRPLPADRDEDLGEARHGLRHDAHRSRDPVGSAGPGQRELLG